MPGTRDQSQIYHSLYLHHSLPHTVTILGEQARAGWWDGGGVGPASYGSQAIRLDPQLPLTTKLLLVSGKSLPSPCAWWR